MKEELNIKELEQDAKSLMITSLIFYILTIGLIFMVSLISPIEVVIVCGAIGLAMITIIMHQQSKYLMLKKYILQIDFEKVNELLEACCETKKNE